MLLLFSLLLIVSITSRLARAIPTTASLGRHHAHTRAHTTSSHLNPLLLRKLQHVIPNLRIRRRLNCQPSVDILPIRLRARFQQNNSRIPVPLSNGMMQSRAPVHIRRVDGTVVLQHELHNRHIPNRRGAMERELASLIFHASGGFVREQLPRGVEVGFAGGEVQRGLAGVGLCGDVGLFGQEEVEQGVAVFDAGGDHEGGPARAVLSIDVEILALGEELDDGDVVVARGPVEGQAVVVIAAGDEFGVGVEEGFD